MNANNTASWNTIVFETWYTEKTISGVYVSPGSASTLVRRGGTRNNHLIVYYLSNISARNYQNRLMGVEVKKCNISVVFLRHSVYTIVVGLHDTAQNSCYDIPPIFLTMMQCSDRGEGHLNRWLGLVASQCRAATVAVGIVTVNHLTRPSADSHGSRLD